MILYARCDYDDGESNDDGDNSSHMIVYSLPTKTL